MIPISISALTRHWTFLQPSQMPWNARSFRVEYCRELRRLSFYLNGRKRLPTWCCFHLTFSPTSPSTLSALQPRLHVPLIKHKCHICSYFSFVYFECCVCTCAFLEKWLFPATRPHKRGKYEKSFTSENYELLHEASSCLIRFSSQPLCLRFWGLSKENCNKNSMILLPRVIADKWTTNPENPRRCRNFFLFMSLFY